MVQEQEQAAQGLVQVGEAQEQEPSLPSDCCVSAN